MRVGVARVARVPIVAIVAGLMLGLSPLRAVQAQTITVVKPGAGEKAHKTKTYPTFNYFHDLVKRGYDDYKLRLSASDTMSASGKRIKALVLEIGHASNQGELPETRAKIDTKKSLDLVSAKELQANLNKVVRLARYHLSPKRRYKQNQDFKASSLVMPGGVELGYDFARYDEYTLAVGSFWAINFHSPETSFESYDMKQLYQLKRQVDECIAWLERKKF